MHKKISIVLGVLIIILIGTAIYFTQHKKVEAPSTTIAETIEYKNTQYGFSMTLPKSWAGYSIVTSEWEGNTYVNPKDIANEQRGPLTSIRHPAWTADNQRQDIPIMVFTLDQWDRLNKDEFHIGAAPINPSELGRNKDYVFALPARYNYAFPLGYEEVEQILRGNYFKGILIFKIPFSSYLSKSTHKSLVRFCSSLGYPPAKSLLEI